MPAFKVLNRHSHEVVYFWCRLGLTSTCTVSTKSASGLRGVLGCMWVGVWECVVGFCVGGCGVGTNLESVKGEAKKRNLPE